jgi:hypothetical protein
MFKRPPAEPFHNLESIVNVKHVEAIQTEAKFTFSLNIVTTMVPGRVCLHTLVSVQVNDMDFLMKDVDLSVVYAVVGTPPGTYLNPTFNKKNECGAFGHFFILLMVYPASWFRRLMGTPSVLQSQNPTMEIRRKGTTLFFLQKTSGTVWEVTPKHVNSTYEYT